MSTRLARTAVAFYPLAYRNRYGEELRALIEESEPGIRDALDLLGGAVKAHICPPESVLRTLSPGDRLVSNIGGMVIAWLVFAAASFAFFHTIDGQSFSDTTPRVLASIRLVLHAQGP